MDPDPQTLEVRRAAHRFRKALEHGGSRWVGFARFPLGACGDASELLGQYLADSGLGEWTYVSGMRDGSTHAWIERDGVVVDITADQFADVTSPCIVTRSSQWHERWTAMAGRHPANLSFMQEVRGFDSTEYETLRARADVEPNPLLAWVADLRRLAVPTPFKEQTCMTGAARQFSRDCCDYHRADWTTINRLILATVRTHFADEPVLLEDVQPVWRSVVATEVSPPSQGLADSLTSWPMHADRDEWTDGQTRGRAMLDQGAHLTLLAN